MISVVNYLWKGSRDFEPAYVNVLARMVAKHLPEPHRFICITDFTSGFSPDVEVLPMPPAAAGLGQLKAPGGEKFPVSYPRLWTFSEDARCLGERVLLLDIDCLIVDDLRPLFKQQADFVGWRVRPPPGGPRRFGGGTWLLRTGTRTPVWKQFMQNPTAAILTAQAAGYRGSDQAWISYCLSESETAWPEPSGIFCAQDYRNGHRSPEFLGRRRRRPRPHAMPAPQVPAGAIILHMNGVQKAWHSPNDPIVKQHWRPFLDEPPACSA